MAYRWENTYFDLTFSFSLSLKGYLNLKYKICKAITNSITMTKNIKYMIAIKNAHTKYVIKHKMKWTHTCYTVRSIEHLVSHYIT